MIIWGKDENEELGRKLRRRKRDEEETHKTVILMTPQQHEREGIFIGLFIEFKLNLPGPSFYPVILMSSCQRSSPQICAPLLPFELTIIQGRSVGALRLQMT